MEPPNRPYVDPATEPGDAGTEPWADGAGTLRPPTRRSADPSRTRSRGPTKVPPSRAHRRTSS
jgi:hypothetical protein